MNDQAINIAQLFDQRVANCADQPALIDASKGRDAVLSFGDLQKASMVMARQLRRDGLQAGQRVLVAVPVSNSLYALLLAIWRLGAVAVFPDPSSGSEQLDYSCRRIEPRAFVGIAKAHLLRLMSPAVRGIEQQYVVDTWAPFARRLRTDSADENLEPIAVEADTPALITFTSGSTGRPKAASRSHGFLLAQYRAIHRALALAPGHRDITTLPVFVLANLAAGVTTLLPPGDLRQPGRVKAEPILAAIEKHGVNRASGSPAFFQRLTDALNGREPLLNQLHTGGAPVTPAMMDSFSALAKNVCAVYGSTEAEPIAELPAGELTESFRRGPDEGRGLPAGKPVPEIALRIVKNRWGHPLGSIAAEELTASGCAPGEVGEIVVSGDHVLPGYLDGEGDTKSKFRVDGVAWHRTGDAGYFDRRGDLWLMGRLDSAVQINGVWLYPFQLEYPALGQPHVKRAALVNLDDGPVLALEFNEGGPRETDSLILPENFPRHRIRPVPEIPLDKRHNAKVDYAALKQLLAKMSD